MISYMRGIYIIMELIKMGTIKKLNPYYCTGCGSCFNSCPVGAIEMKQNDEGFLYPIINNKCINCGLCEKKCPQLVANDNKNKILESYAAWAKSDLRSKGSSGGVFPAIAEYVIKKRGVVFGAAFNDNCRNLSYTKAEKYSELEKLYKSKYVQSDTGEVFKEIKDLLEKKKMVAFCGCPCQVDGLKAFLGKQYDNLLTIDLLCHGAPSPMAYRKFLDEHSNDGTRAVKSVDFRYKEWGWGTLLKFEYEDGGTFFHEWNREYFTAFKSIGFNMRKSCFDCQYSTAKRVGDITLGDFWGVKEILPEYDDNKGTSLVLCNSELGKKTISDIKSYFEKITEVPYDKMFDITKRFNGALTPHQSEPASREVFFKHLKTDNFSTAFRYAAKAQMDIGIVGWWIENSKSNYGSTLTDYALYKFLESKGYSVAVISPPNFNRDNAGEFNKKYGYRMTAKYDYQNMKENNKYFDTYIVASDTLWYYDAMIGQGYNFLLDFADETKKKISYATSFGNTVKFFPEEEMPYAKSLMQKFDYVGVREFEGVEVCKNKFGVQATQVLDPVFLCDDKYYEDVAKNAARKTDGDFIFVYMLDPTEEKANELKKLSKRLGMKLVSITDRQNDAENREKILSECGVLSKANIEEYLWHIRNAKFVLADSFHGLCFSCIFNKPFASLVNHKRGNSRFVTLSAILGIEHRMFDNMSSIVENADNLMNVSDYLGINKRMALAKEKAEKWLISAIEAPKKINPLTDQDIMLRELYLAKRRAKMFEEKLNALTK